MINKTLFEHLKLKSLILMRLAKFAGPIIETLPVSFSSASSVISEL